MKVNYQGRKRYGIWPGRIKKHGFVMVPNILVSYQRRLGLSPQQMNMILHLLSYYWNKERLPFPSKALISNRMGVSTRTVQRITQELENAGYIEKVFRTKRGRGQSSNAYSLDGLINRIVELENEYSESSERLDRIKEREALREESPKSLRRQ